MTLDAFLNTRLIDSDKFSLDISQLVMICLIILATMGAIRLVRVLVFRRARKRGIDRGHAYAIVQLLRYVIWIVSVLTCLQTVGLNLSVLLAGSAALAVGIGFGMQQIFKDLVSGVFLLLEGNIRVGDIMQLEDGTIGSVVSIGFRTTELQTAQGITTIVPNSLFFGNMVINWSHNNARRRASVVLGVAYKSDPEIVREILVNCARKHQDVVKDAEPFVRFINFGDSSIDFELFFWVADPGIAEDVKSDLRFRVFEALKQEQIEIPFPQRVIRHEAIQD